jgi:hypothetical protein
MEGGTRTELPHQGNEEGKKKEEGRKKGRKKETC